MGAPDREIGGIESPDSNQHTIRDSNRQSIGSDRLSHAECEHAKRGESIRKLTDGKGLYLAVLPSGAKSWRLKYRHGGKERIYSIGAFPDISLASARAERDRARTWLREGKDPTIERRVHKAHAGAKQGITFGVVAEEWLGKQAYSDEHRAAQRTRLDRELLPHLSKLPVAEITPAVVLEALQRIERRGALETAAKCRRMTSQIFRFAVQTGRAHDDPAKLLVGAIRSAPVMNRATVPQHELPTLLAQVAAVPAELNTKCAFYWLLLTAARTGEMRFATWNEIHGERWRIPAERMKMRREHVVPLSRQSLALLDRARELRRGAEGSALLFPGFTRAGSLSENALLALLARAGYFGRQTAHGFRASFSTWAHEDYEADPDVIEACLAHAVQGVRGDYNRASYLSKRLALLQAWADQLEAWGLRLP